MERPNILFICTDQEQAFPKIPAEFKLPARERLRRKGLTFLNFQASTTLCTSSRSVIYSGQHAPRNGMWDNLNFSWIADLSVPTLGHMMRQVGYYTAYKGRWLLSEIPENGSASALESYGFADYQEDGDLWGMPQEGYRRDKEVAGDARRWLLEKAPLIERDQPWLLTVNFLNPRDISFYDTDAEGDAHGPGALKNVSAPEDELYKINWQPELATSFDDDLISQPEGVRAFGRFSAGVSGFVPHDRHDLWQAHLNYYLNCLRDSDQWLGLVLDALEESGQAGRTIIMFTSDHGEMGTAHGLRQTGGAAFRELVNVPFIVCHPQVPGRLTTKVLGSAVDIVPTILGLSGLTQEDRRKRFPQVVGRDLSSVFSDPSGDGHRGSPGNRGDGVLYTYDMIHSLDVEWFLRHAIELSDLRYALGKPQPAPLLKDLSEIELPDLSRRRMFRGVFDGRYKLIRYFSPDSYNTPQNIGELFKHNDLALYDLVQDPGETRNLANQKDPGYDESLLLEMNKKLNTLISIELGEDKSVLAPLLSKPSDLN